MPTILKPLLVHECKICGENNINDIGKRYDCLGIYPLLTKLLLISNTKVNQIKVYLISLFLVIAPSLLSLVLQL